MKPLITLATIFTLTSCNPKPKETDVISRVDCELDRTLDSKRTILRYFRTEYKSGYVRVSGSIQQPGSRYIVIKTYKPGDSMGHTGHMTVKTDSEFFVSFMLADKLMFDDKADDLVQSNGAILAIEYLGNKELLTEISDKDECKETKGSK